MKNSKWTKWLQLQKLIAQRQAMYLQLRAINKKICKAQKEMREKCVQSG